MSLESRGLGFISHKVTALWDVRYASAHRSVGPLEQHVHSCLETLPRVAGTLVLWTCLSSTVPGLRPVDLSNKMSTMQITHHVETRLYPTERDML